MITFVKAKLLLNASGKKLSKGGPNITKYLTVGFGSKKKWERQSDPLACRKIGNCWSSGLALQGGDPTEKP